MNGKFSTVQWKYFIEWCKAECNKMVVYSHMSYDIFCSVFSSHCTVKELKKPDETLDIYAYEIKQIDVEFWNSIKEYNYNIDIGDDVSHMYFFNGERNIASLEIVDYENYVVVENPVNQENIFLFQRDMILENVQFCIKGKSDIDELVQGKGWEPLGCGSEVLMNSILKNESVI